MANITASDVNKLRQQTGAGMMDCKKALVEADGDFEKAIDLLRKKGQKVAANRSDREANEGLVIAETSSNGKKGVMIVLNCETDFVAKNEEFGHVARQILHVAMEKAPASLDELKSAHYNGGNLTIEEKLTEEIGKIGEKITLSAYEVIEAEAVVAYNHPGNKLASIIGLNSDGEKINELGRDLAMQVAAMAPVSVDKEDVSQELIDKELEIGREQARAEGKPEEMLDKIAQGKLGKFYKESTLLNQQFIKDNKKTVAQLLKEADSNLKVTGFKRISLS